MMPRNHELLQELRLEAAVTRKYLARVPFEHAAFKPDEKSESLGRLAIHVAEIMGWWRACLCHDELDFIDFEPADIQSGPALVAYFDALLNEATVALTQVLDEEFDRSWSMKHGRDLLFTLPKKQVLRLFCFNHLVHHRAQLGGYLRLLGVAVPAAYGPSADDDEVLLVGPFA